MKRFLGRIRDSAAIRGSMYFATYWSAMALYMPFMALDLSRRGFSGVEIGTTGSLRALVILLASPLLSRLADRKGCRVRMLSSSALVSAFIIIAMMFPQTFPWLLVAVSLLALANAPIDSLGNAITVRMASRFQADFGMMSFWGALFYAVMNLLAGIAWQELGFRWIYLASAVMFLVVGLVSAKLDEPVGDKPALQPVPALPLAKPASRVRTSTILFLGVWFLFSFSFFVAFNFTAPFLDRLGASEMMIGLVGTTVGVGGMLARGGSRKIMDRFHLEAVLITGLVVSIVPMVVYGFSKNVLVIILVSIIRGAGWALFSVGTISFIDRQASVENAGTLQSVVVMLSTLSSIIASPITGSLFDRNPSMMFVVSTCGVVAALALMLVVRMVQKKETTAPVLQENRQEFPGQFC
ncbi:MAG: MFS transporter [Anaerolineae bacterium]|nr:MFS transporter [Anaerolineae bacterium]